MMEFLAEAERGRGGGRIREVLVSTQTIKMI
jgi:hypothetical protein